MHDRRRVRQLERVEDLRRPRRGRARRPPRTPRAAAAVRLGGVVGREIDGIATSRARSAFSCGIDPRRSRPWRASTARLRGCSPPSRSTLPNQRSSERHPNRVIRTCDSWIRGDAAGTRPRARSRAAPVGRASCASRADTRTATRARARPERAIQRQRLRERDRVASTAGEQHRRRQLGAADSAPKEPVENPTTAWTTRR